MANLFYSPVCNRTGLTGWIRAAQPAQPYAELGYPGIDYPRGMGYPGAGPIQYPQLNYPQLHAAPVLYPRPYAQPYIIGGYSQSSLQPYPQPVYPPMINQLPVYPPMISRVPYGYLPY